MTNEETIGKLSAMRLTAMASAFREQLRTPAIVNLSFEDRLGLLTDIEWTSRKNNRLKKLVKEAQFDQPQAHIAGIDYTAQRQLDPALIARLAACTVASAVLVWKDGKRSSPQEFLTQRCIRPRPPFLKSHNDFLPNACGRNQRLLPASFTTTQALCFPQPVCLCGCSCPWS